MKTETRLIVLIILMVIGVGLLIWGNVIMMRYEGFREIWKAARHAALPQMISGLGLMIVGYILTFGKKE